MWSQIKDKSILADIADARIYCNELSGCHYHNIAHVNSMYQYLEDTNEPYDAALDWAILFHDIIYDNQPEKEKRSADFFLGKVEKPVGCYLLPWEQERVHSLIMCTADHIVRPGTVGSSAIIRADLHGLSNTISAFNNFTLILKESIELYGIDEKSFAENSIQFMLGLRERVVMNMDYDDEIHKNFYQKVKNGISTTIDLSHILLRD